jgi:hypothetical protein
MYNLNDQAEKLIENFEQISESDKKINIEQKLKIGLIFLFYFFAYRNKMTGV